MPFKMRRIYLDTIRERYKNAPKRQKGNILQEFCINCGYSRKYAIRVLNGALEPRLSKPGPKRKYGPEFVEVLRNLWKAMDYPCSKKMVVATPLWIDFLKGVSPEIQKQLLSVSSSTVDRILKPFKKKRGISTTFASLIKTRIPIKLLDGDVLEPGFVEADTVAHCGDSAAGSFTYSLTITDLYSAWTENRAIWTKASEPVLKQIQSIEEGLPFLIKGFACDNGTEFLNQNLENHFKGKLHPVEFVRRRPYKKNDSAHVEQKNWTHVRKLYGYQRFDHPELAPVMNEIYRAYWNPLQNFYMPTMKLKEKIRIGSKIKRIYDEPQTPCQRLLASPDVPNHIKLRLKQEQKAKNPFFLKEQLDKRLKYFFDLVDELNRNNRQGTGTPPLGYIFQ